MLATVASTLAYISSVKVHPAFPFLITPTLHAARVSMAYQANARKSSTPLSWGTYIAGYLIMCWGGGLLTHFMLGLPPPMLYSVGPWINYLAVHLALTVFFSFFPSLLHPPIINTALFPLDALVRTNAVVAGVSHFYPSSPNFNHVSPLYIKSPLTHMIVGALSSAGGAMSAGTLSTWTQTWGVSTPPVFRPGVGVWGNMDVWGGSVIAAVYGIAMDHPAFKGSIPLLFFSTPLISQLLRFVYPRYQEVYAFESFSLKPADAKALAGVVFTLFFGLKVYYVHWTGSTGGGGSNSAPSSSSSSSAKASNGRKAAGAAAIRRHEGEK